MCCFADAAIFDQDDSTNKGCGFKVTNNIVASL